MARRVFYSFHYTPDNWRASQVRNIGVVEGNRPASDNDWEAVTRGGDAAIERWIDAQMAGRSCAVVLIGSLTAGRKWINYEIQKAWKDGLGVVGIHIHNLKDVLGNQSNKGKNPFEEFSFNDKSFAAIVKAYDPPYWKSADVYANIAINLEKWVEEAVAIRGRN